MTSLVHLPSVRDHERAELLDELLDFGSALPMITMIMSRSEVHECAEKLERGSGPLTHAELLELIVSIVETLFDDEVTGYSIQFHAQLVMMLIMPAIPESLVLQVAFGRSVGEEQSRRVVRLVAKATRRGLTVDEYVAELVAADGVPHDRIVRLFLGESRRRPSEERMQGAIALLRRTAALAAEPFRPQILAAIAWMMWARGRRALAIAYLDEALRIEPENPLAGGLRMHVERKSPEWISGA